MGSHNGNLCWFMDSSCLLFRSPFRNACRLWRQLGRLDVRANRISAVDACAGAYAGACANACYTGNSRSRSGEHTADDRGHRPDERDCRPGLSVQADRGGR
jgi:hypothetical protein